MIKNENREEVYMDTISAIVLFGFIIIIIFYLNNIKEIIIPTNKSKLEIITIIISMLITLFISLYYGTDVFHYLIRGLGTSVLALGLFRRGITQNGFQSMRGINIGNWNKLEGVHIIRGNEVKITYTGQSFSYDVHYYSNDYYDEIIDLLKKNISPAILTIE